MTLRHLAATTTALALSRCGPARFAPLEGHPALARELAAQKARETAPRLAFAEGNLERSATTRSSADAARMKEEAAAIRAGRMPERYQRALFNGSV